MVCVWQLDTYNLLNLVHCHMSRQQVKGDEGRGLWQWLAREQTIYMAQVSSVLLTALKSDRRSLGGRVLPFFPLVCLPVWPFVAGLRGSSALTYGICLKITLLFTPRQLCLYISSVTCRLLLVLFKPLPGRCRMSQTRQPLAEVLFCCILWSLFISSAALLAMFRHF